MTTVIDGDTIARGIREDLAGAVDALADGGTRPCRC
jgi:hypothetical protein